MRTDPEEIFDRLISPSIMPLSAGYTAGGLVKAYQTLASAVAIHHVTITEAVLQISLSLIATTPAIIGGVTLAGGLWLKHVRTQAKEERDHVLAMAKLGIPIVPEIKSSFPFGRVETAKPNEDTVDLK